MTVVSIYRFVDLPNSKWRPSGDWKWNEKIHPRERWCVTHRCVSEIVFFHLGVTSAHVFWLAHVGRGDLIGQELVSLRTRHARCIGCSRAFCGWSVARVIRKMWQLAPSCYTCTNKIFQITAGGVSSINRCCNLAENYGLLASAFSDALAIISNSYNY